MRTEDDDRRTIRIEDDGPGLPETEREVLTTRTETPLTHSAGMGLWLAIGLSLLRRNHHVCREGASRSGHDEPPPTGWWRTAEAVTATVARSSQ
ncbi:hypothetical protein C8039_04105 [Halogeometricum sp. wsp3]|nr:hypothetical protein C8039_04105 [Halogeometricum sp. wsp3]